MEILIITVLLILNGVFSMFEIALVSSRKSRLQEKANFGSQGAKTALLLLHEPEKILSALQVCITLVGIVSGAFGGIALSEDMVPVFQKISFLAPYADVLAVTFVVGFITYFSLIIGELVPKTIALNNPERIAIALSPAMKITGSVLYPVVIFLSVSTKMVLTLFRVKKKADVPITEEELRLLLKQGSEQGVIEKEESDIINEVIRFGDKNAGSIMTPRGEVEWIDSTDTPEEILEMVKKSSFSRMPVCVKSIEEVTGIAAKKDILTYYINNQSLQLDSLLVDPLFVPEQMPAIKVLQLFRETKNHFAIVINEYGSMEGIVTLHDVTENLIGDLPESEDGDEPEAYKRDDGSYLIDGSMKLGDVKDLLEIRYLYEKGRERTSINTIGGYAMFKLNKIPRIGDKFRIEGFVFEIVDMDGNRVDKLMASLSKDID